MNIGPIAPTFNKTQGTPRNPRRANQRRHFPKSHVRVGNHHTPLSLQHRQHVPRDDRVRVSHARWVESIDAVLYEMLISFEVQKAVARGHYGSQRALAAARKPAQHHAIEPRKSLHVHSALSVT